MKIKQEENTKKRVVRQAEEDGRQAGPFDLFGQVINSFGEKENCGK